LLHFETDERGEDAQVLNESIARLSRLRSALESATGYSFPRLVVSEPLSAAKRLP